MLLKSYILYRYLESPKPQKPWKTKKKEVLGVPGKPKKQNFEENGWFWLKRLFFVFPRFCLFLVGFNSQPWVFFAYILLTNIPKNKKLKLFFGCVIFPFFVIDWYGFKSQTKMFFFAYMLSTNIFKKQKDSSCFSFVVMVWYGFKSQKQKKTLSFCFLQTCYQRYLKNKLRSFSFLCFCCYGLICYAVFDSKSTRHIA